MNNFTHLGSRRTSKDKFNSKLRHKQNVFSPKSWVIIAIFSAVLLAGCSMPEQQQVQQDNNADSGLTQQQATSAATPPVAAAPQKKGSETATKIYIGMRQTGLKEVVVDVQRNEVVIGFREQAELNDEALIYTAFGLSAQFEPGKEKTTALVFLSGGKRIEASASQEDILALSKGDLNNSQFNERVRWVK